MKVTIGETPAMLTCTEAGKQALKTDKLMPRQRQFILLIEENTRLGEQAVSNLLPKLDLQVLIEKGWVSCDVPQVQVFKQPTAVTQLVNSVASSEQIAMEDSCVISKKSFDKKQGGKDLQSFLNTYANDSHNSMSTQSPDVSNIRLPSLHPAQSFYPSIAAIQNQKLTLKIPEALQSKTDQELEDIIILQSLLDD